MVKIMTKKNIKKKSNNIKKKAKKGFTLIEIIAVIIIIGILAIIMVPAVSRYVNRSKDTTYTAYEKNMKVATNNKVVECVSGNDKNCRLPDEGERVLVYLDELVENGYLDNLKDPEADGFCDSVLSYVQIENTGSADYEYKACLYCANYITDDEICTEYEKDEDKPTCGEINGASTKWTNANRTISVGCNDNSSGCRYTVFSKTFKETTKESTIKITDNSGNTNECPVEVYVDKDKPTCTLEVVGGTEEATGWLSGNVQVKLTGWDDNESGVLTYGIGTSINNRNYNKQTSISVKQGLTTVIGYVKDYAGNEGVCSVDVRVGAPRPKFDVEYGYQIYPNKETYTLTGITESGTKLTTTTTTPTISFTGLNNYKNVNRVVIYFNDPIPQNTTATIIHGTGETKGLLVAGQSKAEFLIPVGTYPNLKIVLGTLSGITYNIDEIELMVGDRTTLFTNKDVTVSLVPKEEVVRTTDYSFDNGTTWGKSSIKEYQENTTNVAKTKNIAELISDAKPISIQNIDKNLPTVTITAKKMTAGTTVASGVWSTEGLNFILTSGNVGVSGATIYYCQDGNNTCNPTTTVATGTTITAFNTTEDTYYIRYKVVSGAGTSSVISSYTAKVDIRKPTITSVTGNPTEWTNQNVTLKVNGAADNTGGSGLQASAYSFDNGTTWQSGNTKTYTGNTSNIIIKVRDVAGNIYTHPTINITKIDKSDPTVTMVATKKGTTTAVASGTWSTSTLEYTFTSSGVGISGATIYYCKDTANTCTPNTKTATSGTKVTEFNTTEDTYYIRYKVVSGAGTESTISSYTAKVDIKAPTITSVTGNPTEWTNQNVTLKVNGAADNTGGSGLQASAYSFDNGTTWQSGNTKTYTGNTSNIIIKVRDVAGNIYTHPTINITKIDKSEPAVTVVATKKGTTTAVTSGTWSTSTLEYTFTSSGVGISGATIYYCKDTANTCNPTTKTATSGTKVTEFNTTEDTYYIRYKVVSGAGYESTTSSYTAKVDIKAPTITSVTGNPTSWTNQNVTLKVNGAADNTGGSGLQASAYSFDNGTTWQSGNTKTYTGNTSNIIIKVRDVAGNVYTHSAINITKVDKSEPTVTITAKKKTAGTTVATNTWSNQGLNFTFTSANVGSSGATIYHCKANSNSCTPNVSGTSTTAYNTTEGIYYIRYKIVSGAGYESEILSYTAKVDLTGPTFTVTGNPTAWTKNDVTLTVNATDGGSGLHATAYSFDGGSTWQTSNQKTYSSNQTVKIKVRDAVGNQSNVTTVDITKIDKTAPTITSVTGNPTNWTNQNVTLTVNATDSQSGLNSSAYSFDDGATWQASSSKTYSSNQTVKIKVRDAVGNISAATTVTINKIDKTAPECTSDGSSTSWTNSSRTITYGCSDATSGCNSSYSGGSKTFSSTTKTSTISAYEIRDKAGNVTNCPEKTVNVYVDKTAPECTKGGDNSSWTSSTITITYGCKDTDSGCNSSYSGGSKSVSSSAQTVSIAAYEIRDKAGNVTNCPARTANAYVDKNSPTCSFSYSTKEWTNQKVGVTFNAKDTGGSKIEYYTYTFNGSTTRNEVWNNEFSSQNVWENTSSPIVFRVYDAAGNSGSCSLSISNVDQENPTCTMSLSSSGWTNGSVTATINGDDGISGVEYYRYGVSGSWTTTKTKTVSDETDSNGTILFGYVKDKAGNKGSCNGIYKIDKTNPSCTITASGTTGTNGWYKGNVTLNSTYSDALSGVSEKGMGAFSSANYNGFSELTRTGDTDGLTFRCFVKDAAGNTASKSITIKKDSTAPSVSLTMGSCTNGGYCSANATGSDATSGVSYIQYCASSSTCTPSSTQPSGVVTVRTGQYFCARAVDKAGNVGSTKCERAPCTAGSYMTSSGCSVCAAGTYSSSGATSCTKCPAGKYSSSEASSCTACPEGTYASGTGNTSCTTCPPAMFNTGTGNTTCDQCTAGYYCPGNNVKTKCPTGYTSDAGAAAAASCHMNVPAGKYLVAYASTATNCPSGKYKSTDTKVFYGDSSSCDQCAAGRYASGTGNTTCTKCPAGTYTSTAGLAACSECPADTYASGTGNNKCLPCATGYSSSVGSSSCSDTTKPTCSWTHGSWGTSTTATIKGSDSGSGVSQISNGTGYISGSSTTRTFTATGTHTGYVKDAAGNTNTCKITIESRTRYRQRTCSTCSSCSSAGYTTSGTGTNRCTSSPSVYKTCDSVSSGSKCWKCTYQSGTGNGCTVGQYYCKQQTRTDKKSCSTCGCSSWGSWTGYNYDSCSASSSSTSKKECGSRTEYK